MGSHMTHCAALSAQRIAQAATLGTASTSGNEIVPQWFRRILVFLILPRLLRTINASLSNERLALLSIDEANALVRPIHELHRAMLTVVDRYGRRVWCRIFLSRWLREMTSETERLGDIAEAILWGADEELRQFIERSAQDVQAEHDRATLPA